MLLLYPTRLLCPWGFLGRNIGVGCQVLLQGISPTQGLNLRLLHWQVGPLPLSHLRSLFLNYKKILFHRNFFFHACVLSCVRLLATPWTVIHTRLLCPWDFSVKKAGVNCHFLLQGIFLTQRSNPSLMSSALAGRFFTTGTPGKSYFIGMPQSKLNKLIFTKHGDNAWHIAGTA